MNFLNSNSFNPRGHNLAGQKKKKVGEKTRKRKQTTREKKNATSRTWHSVQWIQIARVSWLSQASVQKIGFSQVESLN